eukprot:TRINITY_DN8425_c0_g1_i1.p1 TRINITY_DN8425_c0_g1~~TRINITY_DN8425_c0_g1_i1.p1  ORF type:complete len:450 (-),score=63.44 TRINITY_DN8425_c0_g1_i1:139-1386(-)
MKAQTFECAEIDVIYTWVNASDPIVVRNRKTLQGHHDDLDMARIRDYGTLQYSLRGIERFAPWIRNVVLITSGEIPAWLDTTNPRLVLLTHTDLFSDPSALPTFNSNGIESQFHNLPASVAECAIYLNDDMFFFAPMHLADFFDVLNNRMVLRFAPFTAPVSQHRIKTDPWHHSISVFNNDLLNKHYHPDTTPSSPELRHHYYSHQAYFFQKKLLRSFYETWKREVDVTARNRQRTIKDVQMPFLYGNYVLHVNKGIDQRDYIALNGMPRESGALRDFYGVVTNDAETNRAMFAAIEARGSKCVCLNDGIVVANTPAARAAFKQTVAALETFLSRHFPYPSSFEKSSETTSTRAAWQLNNVFPPIHIINTSLVVTHRNARTNADFASDMLHRCHPCCVPPCQLPQKHFLFYHPQA